MRTVEDLQDYRERLGLHADEVGRAEDPQARRDEGVLLFRRMEDGRCQTFVMGRGDERDHRVFESEAEAVRDAAARVHVPEGEHDPVEHAASRERMKARAEETLRRIEASQRKSGGDDARG